MARFYCLHPKCTMEYKIEANDISDEFSVHCVGEIKHVKKGVVRPLNGFARV